MGISRELARWLTEHVRDYDLVHVHAFFSYVPLPVCASARRARVPLHLQARRRIWMTGRLRQRPIRKCRVFLAVYGRGVPPRRRRGSRDVNRGKRADDLRPDEPRLGDAESVAESPDVASYRRHREAKSWVPELLACALYLALTRRDPSGVAVLQAVYRLWRTSKVRAQPLRCGSSLCVDTRRSNSSARSRRCFGIWCAKTCCALGARCPEC